MRKVVTFDKEDNERYRGFFGSNLYKRKAALDLIGEHHDVLVHDLVAKQDLIAPSKREQIQTFIDMYKENPTGIGQILGRYHATQETYDFGNPLFKKWYEKRYGRLSSTEQVTKGYKVFVKTLGDANNKELRDEYFRRLSSKGYNMIEDAQDAGRQAYHPSIVFDRTKTLEVVGSRNLTLGEMKSTLKKYGRFLSRKNRHNEWEVGKFKT